MNELLLPCPFCGRIPEITRCDVEPRGDSWYGSRVERFVICACGTCRFEDYFHEGFTNDKEAIVAWNRRVLSPLLLLLRELREALESYMKTDSCDIIGNPETEQYKKALDVIFRVDKACADAAPFDPRAGPDGPIADSVDGYRLRPGEELEEEKEEKR